MTGRSDIDPPPTAQNHVEHVDVVIVGAGISGIGMARYLGGEHPDLSYLVLDARDDLGGTWSLFRYPGVRSDSDLYTFGYEFKPWTGHSIADGDAILGYLREAAQENGIEPHIRYRHRVIRADWSSDDARWTVNVERTDTGQRLTLTTWWLVGATGYYRYDQGYTPAFSGIELYRGRLVHPQHWPADLDCTGKRVVVIGSGATAVTLVPALAEKAAHVTMLQRTPSYVLSLPRRDIVAGALTRTLGAGRAHRVVRRKNILGQWASYSLMQRFPRQARAVIRRLNRRALPSGYDVDTHFTPPYQPWDQRLCVVPDNDLFQAISAGRASVVTDTVSEFTERGVRTGSGTEIDADVVVTATGFTLRSFGGIRTTVDGVDMPPASLVAFKGMMMSGLPNFAFFIGYTNASWTLKVTLVAEHLCRLIRHMRDHGHTSVVARAPHDIATRPLIDFGAGYVQRTLDALPRQGPAWPWEMSWSYLADEKRMRRGPVDDPHLSFGSARRAGAAAPGR
ncbi:MAG: flavin-containing monooxygenase [Phycicoccus sp.]